MPPKRRSPRKKKTSAASVAGGRGGEGKGQDVRGDKLPSLDPDSVEDATRVAACAGSPSSSRQASTTRSRSGSRDSRVSETSQASAMVRNKREKKDYKLSDEEEELMVGFLETNEMLWNKKAMNYRRPDLKDTAWQKQAEVLSKEVSHLKGWFKGIRDNFARMDKVPKSGSGQRILTERELWTQQKFHFLRKITYHRPQPVSSVSTAPFF